MDNSKVKLLAGGAILFVSIGVWFGASALVKVATPPQPKQTVSSTQTTSSEEETEVGTPVGLETTVSVLDPADELKDYSERKDRYYESALAFMSHYDLGSDLEVDEVYSSSAYYVVLKADGGQRFFVMTPNGTVDGYFSPNLEEEDFKKFKGFRSVQDQTTGLKGVMVTTRVDSIELEDYQKNGNGYDLATFPINEKFVENISSYQPYKYVNITFVENRYPTKVLAYKGDQGLVLVSQSNLLVGSKPTDSWKEEVFRRAGSGTEVEIEGEKLWAYIDR